MLKLLQEEVILIIILHYMLNQVLYVLIMIIFLLRKLSQFLSIKEKIYQILLIRYFKKIIKNLLNKKDNKL